MARKVRRPGPTTIDEPIRVLGVLELPEDVILLVFGTAVLIPFMPVYLAGVLGVGMAFVLGRMKVGKPRGYVNHLVMRSMRLEPKGFPRVGRYRV